MNSSTMTTTQRTTDGTTMQAITQDRYGEAEDVLRAARLPRHRLSSSRYSLAWLPAVPGHGARLNGGYRSVTRTNA